jgi:protein-disulfide isomerase
MAESFVKATLLPAGLAALVSGGAVYAALTLWQPTAGGPAFEAAVHAYLMSNPGILFEMQDAYNTQRAEQQETARINALAESGMAALTDPAIAHVEGPADAPVTVVEFFDYRCGYCKASLPAIKAVLAANPDVRFSFIEYPILTQDSRVAATAAVAARRQEGLYVPFHLALMEAEGELPLERILGIAAGVGLDIGRLQQDMMDPAVQQSIEASRALAQSLHVNGTPAFVINGEFIIGAMTEEELSEAIAEARG